MASIALAYAYRGVDSTKSSYYIDDLFYNSALGKIDEAQLNINNIYFPYGWLSKGGDKRDIFVNNMVDWQNSYTIALYAMLKLIVTNESSALAYKHPRLTSSTEKYNYIALRERMCNLFAATIDGGKGTINGTSNFGITSIDESIKYAPYNVPEPNMNWGWNRYMVGTAIIPFLFGEYIASNKITNPDAVAHYLNYEKYYSFGLDVSNYLFGMNPWDMSLVVGGGKKFSHHIHNRTATGELTNTGSPAYNFIPPYGALTAWEAPSNDMIEDVSPLGIGRGFQNTETCTDFSLPLMLMMVQTSSEVTTSVNASIKEYNANKITVYPNPVVDYLHISSDLEGKIFIVNSNNKVIQEALSNSVNLSTLPKGLYYCVISKDGEYQSIKSFYKE